MKVIVVLIIMILGGVNIGLSQTQDADTVVYDAVEKDAEFPEKYGSLPNWIEENFEFISKQKKTDSGKVVVEFCIEIDGELTNISIREGISKSVDYSVIEMMKKMPKWIPGMINDKTVRSWFTLPILID